MSISSLLSLDEQSNFGFLNRNLINSTWLEAVGQSIPDKPFCFPLIRVDGFAIDGLFFRGIALTNYSSNTDIMMTSQFIVEGATLNKKIRADGGNGIDNFLTKYWS